MFEFVPNGASNTPLDIGNGGTGATTAAGALTALGAASASDVDPIGTIVADSASVSLASNASSPSEVTSVTLPAGTWVIQGTVSFAANATGTRLITISPTSGSSQTSTVVQVSAASAGGTYLHTGFIVALSASTTYYLNARQNSGSTLTTQGWLRAVRIK